MEVQLGSFEVSIGSRQLQSAECVCLFCGFPRARQGFPPIYLFGSCIFFEQADSDAACPAQILSDRHQCFEQRAGRGCQLSGQNLQRPVFCLEIGRSRDAARQFLGDRNVG